MIVLMRLRNITIFALLVLAISFIYIGYNYTGFEEEFNVTEKDNPVSVSNLKEDINEDINKENENITETLSPLVDKEKNLSFDNFYAEFRIKRDKGRAAQLEILREVVNNPKSSEKIRNEAQEKLLLISENIAAEIKAENLLKAKGYEEAVVLVEADNVTVVVKDGDGLEKTDIVRIGDLITRATGYKLEQIAIIPKQ